jgi:hypothetical protein
MKTTNRTSITFGVSLSLHFNRSIHLAFSFAALHDVLHKKMQEPCALLPESLLQSGRSGVAAIDLRDLAYYCFLHPFVLAPPFVVYMIFHGFVLL